MARSDPQLNIRIPAEMKERLEDAAKHSGRSVTQELIHRLDQSLDDRPAQTRKDSYALSTIERLEGMLVATEGQRDATSQQTLLIATALAAAYPCARALMNTNPQFEEQIGRILDLGLRATRTFVSTYKPIGIDSAISTLNNIQRVLGPALQHLNREEREVLSATFGAEANDFLKRLEADNITYIKKVLDEYDVPDADSDSAEDADDTSPEDAPQKPTAKRISRSRPKKTSPEGGSKG